MVILAVGVFPFHAFAQTSGVPVVTIEATKPIASSPASPGIFTVFRAGDTNETLNVYYDIGGSASNGVDYAQIGNFVQIAAGAVSNSIVIIPSANAAPASAGKTVILQLGSSPLANPVNYEIGVPSNAVVTIENPVLSLGIVTPKDGAQFFTPTNIQIVANGDGYGPGPTHFEFFAGANDLGPGTIGPSMMQFIPENGWNLAACLTWTNPAAGQYPLTVVADFSGGISFTSPVVNITVLPATISPPFGVKIISPANGSVFRAPIDLPLFAYVTPSTDATISVEFYDGTNDLGSGQPTLPPTPVSPTGSNNTPDSGPVPAPPIYPTNVFSLVWSNAPAGNHVLTAQAMIAFIDHPLVLLTKSAPVNVTILPPVPPPTNCPAIVSIVATDPVAVAGTNCWVWMGEPNSPPTWAAWSAAVCQFFTNSGPKTATFIVRRFGDTNDELNVTYDIGGTASNGVDYVALPGFVTVPAGERSALISVVPIDHSVPNPIKTVILSLTPSTNLPPDYVVGYPPRAAVIITDCPGPIPAAGMLPDKCFHLSLPGPDAAWFSIEYSTNLIDWTPICTNQVINGSIDFIDPGAPDNVSRFYQVTPLTNGPTD